MDDVPIRLGKETWSGGYTGSSHRAVFFDRLLEQAVESIFDGSQYISFDEWNKAIARSSVRMQWDPDHNPRGGSLERRALQLEQRGHTLKDYGKKEILEIINISSFVAEQCLKVTDEKINELVTPSER